MMKGRPWLQKSNLLAAQAWIILPWHYLGPCWHYNVSFVPFLILLALPKGQIFNLAIFQKLGVFAAFFKVLMMKNKLSGQPDSQQKSIQTFSPKGKIIFCYIGGQLPLSKIQTAKTKVSPASASNILISIQISDSIIKPKMDIIKASKRSISFLYFHQLILDSLLGLSIFVIFIQRLLESVLLREGNSRKADGSHNGEHQEGAFGKLQVERIHDKWHNDSSQPPEARVQRVSQRSNRSSVGFGCKRVQHLKDGFHPKLSKKKKHRIQEKADQNTKDYAQPIEKEQ